MKHLFSLTLMMFLSSLILISLSCNSESKHNNVSPVSYQNTKMSLEEKEKRNPTTFLTIKATYKKNLLGEWIIEGTISNTAKIATFKDVILEISFYSKTETHLGTKKEAIYEYFPAGKTKSFKIKNYGYKGTSSIGLAIIDAVTAN